MHFCKNVRVHKCLLEQFMQVTEMKACATFSRTNRRFSSSSSRSATGRSAETDDAEWQRYKLANTSWTQLHPLLSPKRKHGIIAEVNVYEQRLSQWHKWPFICLDNIPGVLSVIRSCPQPLNTHTHPSAPTAQGLQRGRAFIDWQLSDCASLKCRDRRGSNVVGFFLILGDFLF